MKRIRIAISSSIFLLSHPAFADRLETIHIGQNHCAYENSHRFTSGPLRLFSSDNEAQQVVNRILRLQGMSLDNANFVLKAAIGNRISNAAAVVQNQKRYLLYKQSFIQDANRQAGTNWAGISIMAHEIAHHMHGHTLQLGGSRPNDELYADRWSGFVLYKLGASRDEATAAVKTIAPLRETASHPGRAERVDAIIHGWSSAQELAKEGNSKAANSIPRTFVRETPSTAIPIENVDINHSHGGRSHRHPLPVEGMNHQHTGVPSKAARLESKVLEPEMVLIRGGTFIMGSPNSEKSRVKNEKQHRVTLGNFGIGKYEVTNQEYARCVNAGSCEPPWWQEKNSFFNLQTGKNNKHYLGFTEQKMPVVGVSWNNAMSYARWLSKETGKRYSLPTEAQWEYAARAGSKTAYPWGAEAIRSYANFGTESCCMGKISGDDRWLKTAPVGSFRPNTWKLHDIIGNIAEWTCSAYDRNYGGSEQKCAPTERTGTRVLRGGSWNTSPNYMRSAARFRNKITHRSNTVGFRLSRTL